MPPTKSTLRAPVIGLRRWAKLVRILAFLICVGVIAYFSWKIVQINLITISVFWAWIIVNSLAWGWELTSLYKGGAPLLMSSENPPIRHHSIRVGWFSAVVIVNFALMLSVGVSPFNPADLTIIMVALYNIFALAWLEYDALRWFPLPKSDHGLSALSLLWIFVSILSGILVYISLRHTPDAYEIGIGTAMVITAVSIAMFIMQRLEVEDRARSEVIRDLSTNLLGVNQTQDKWDYVVRDIGEKLRYRRVFILEPSIEQGSLKIVGQYGDYPEVAGKDFPLDVGITGQAYHTGKTVAWNDIRECPYYHRLVDEEIDDTKAEIAIPIEYLGVPYGILDVQDPNTGVYHKDDIRSLEVIARILGAGISAQKTDLLVEDAYSLWEELSWEAYTEEDIFREFARFARRKLGADVVIYYPLSPAGFPIKSPEIEGNLNYPERMESPISSFNSPLFRLIRDWSPRFIESVDSSPLFPLSTTNISNFSVREKVKSVCFIPLGTIKEKLGIMFLNFREQRRFDGLFKFMVLSFSQTFAMLAIRNRYRNIMFEGYGRPELGIHNLFSRYGLKTGVMEEGAKIFESSCKQTDERDFSSCGMLGLLSRIDNFLHAANMVDASIPPLLWRQSLQTELEEYASALPPSQQQTPRPLTTITIDPLLEREGSWVKLAIYRVITEAMNNAVFHGAAKEIIVDGRRREHELWLQIKNDGIPLPESAGEKRSRRGIFSLLKDLEVRFRATTSVQKRPDNKGTVVDILIPTIPITREEWTQ